LRVRSVNKVSAVTIAMPELRPEQIIHSRSQAGANRIPAEPTSINRPQARPSSTWSALRLISEAQPRLAATATSW
jgi:hypothetical protein